MEPRDPRGGPGQGLGEWGSLCRPQLWGGHKQGIVGVGVCCSRPIGEVGDLQYGVGAMCWAEPSQGLGQQRGNWWAREPPPALSRLPPELHPGKEATSEFMHKRSREMVGNLQILLSLIKP